MRELKGDWRDLFSGFMIALDLRKMLFAFFGLLLTIVLLGGITFGWVLFFVDGGSDNVFKYDSITETSVVRLPANYAPHSIYSWFHQRWFGFHTFVNQKLAYVNGIYSTGQPKLSWGLYTIIALLIVTFIWSYFGGAIARSAACEIAREGERIETGKALKYAGSKFWSFFGAPLICVLGFLFFFMCNFIAGLVFKVLDLAYIGAPLAALFLPLALLSGFVMTLIVIGTLAGFPLFLPAVAAEGTDAFDAFSRGFSYVYSKPWHYVWYQLVSGAYGYLCIAFVIIFTVFMCYVGLTAGAAGFDLVIRADHDQFDQINDYAWSWLLSPEHADRTYSFSPTQMARDPHPYGWIMHLSGKIAKPKTNVPRPQTKLHLFASVIVIAWLIVVLGLAYSFAISYFISQQTMIYFILRKKVDEIEMKEIYYEEEEQKVEPVAGEVKVEKPAEAAKPPEEKKPG